MSNRASDQATPERIALFEYPDEDPLIAYQKTLVSHLLITCFVPCQSALCQAFIKEIKHIPSILV